MSAAQTDAAQRLIHACDKLIRHAGSAQAVTTRQVAEAAGTSISTIAHHFGTFDGLIAEVGLRAYRRLNHERMSILQRAVERAHPETPDLRHVLRALVEPPVRWHFDGDRDYCVLLSINTLVSQGSSGGRFRQIEACLDPHRAIVHHLHRSAPWFSEAEIGWRVYAVLAIRTQALRRLYRSEALTQGKLDLDDPEVVIASLVDLAVPMFADPEALGGATHRF